MARYTRFPLADIGYHHEDIPARAALIDMWADLEAGTIPPDSAWQPEDGTEPQPIARVPYRIRGAEHRHRPCERILDRRLRATDAGELRRGLPPAPVVERALVDLDRDPGRA